MTWDRDYITDNKQGNPPERASDIFQYGDVILVTQHEDGYHLSQLPRASSALVSISPDNGAIKAAIGGFSFKQSQFNRVNQARRQVGSNIKPFIYSAALDNGFTLASLINDAPINQWDKSSGVVWRPKNSPPTYDGPIRVRLALAQSKNVIAVRLLREVGLRKIIDHLTSFGFAPHDLPRNESLALGSASLSPLEVATGFATFANGGFLVQPYLIERIEDSFGNIIFQATPALACEECSEINESERSVSEEEIKTPATYNTPLIANGIASDVVNDSNKDELNLSILDAPKINRAERVLSAQNAFLTTQALNSAIWGADWSVKPGWQGTGFRARTLKRRDIAGKTGTTNEAKDAWFSGFSRRLVTTSWIGFDNPSRSLGKTRYNRNLGKNQITGKEFGAKSAQPAWILYMKEALQQYPYEAFEQPSDILSVRIDKATGKLSKKTDKTSLFEYFMLGTAPTEYVTDDKSSEIFDNDYQLEETEETLF